MKISVILPSFLGEYSNAANDRESKLIRAIDSFLQQTYSNKELIIISDGCDATERIWFANYMWRKNIIYVALLKQPLFSGSVRQAGIDRASGDIITYLDSDDSFLSDHLENIVNNFGKNDWVYFNHTWAWPDKIYEEISTSLKHGCIGTSSIAHKKNITNWTGCNGYGHDWQFICRLAAASKNHKKINIPAGYLVRHIPGKFEN